MAKKLSPTMQNLLDAVRPTEADGALRTAILSTYGLGLEQPNFFEHDFLPTLLGLGGIRDRGYVAPVTLERKLGEIYCGLICDAHALAAGGRPSLRVDVMPVSRPRHHAKLVLIHRQRLIRVIVSSANLTHTGYRSQREAAAVLDFRPDGGLPIGVLRDFVGGWLESVQAFATIPMRDALEEALHDSAKWPARADKTSLPQLRVVFGGGANPLWRQFVEAWPRDEPVLAWQIGSPFWPGPDSHRTPFEVIAEALSERGAAPDNAEIELICCADVPGENGRPVFPFALMRGLRERNFPIVHGRILPARLDATPDEVPEKMAEGQRELHAKWMLLRGPRTVVALLGSANFTNPGLGVTPNANIEAGVLITGSCDLFREADWKPPLVDAGAVDWATCASHSLATPPLEPDDPFDWPNHVLRVELDILWGQSPDPPGTLIVSFARESYPTTAILEPNDTTEREIARFVPGNDGTKTIATFPVDATIVRRLLVRRSVQVRWGEPQLSALFPINIFESAKSGLPSVLGARPDEQQLLAYFHGRIGEDDLLALLEQRAQQLAEGKGFGGDGSPPADLQNYLIREFVESLYGLEATLRQTLHSHRALEAALLGEFSPLALADRILVAFRAGRRSATAAAFQFAELLRLVASLPLDSSDADQELLADVVRRGVDRLLKSVSEAARSGPFAAVLRDRDFTAYVRAALPKDAANRFLATIAAPPKEPIHVPEP